MKILVICQYYYPEPFRIPDICEELSRRGHEVFVVTGEPNYPEGVRYEDYEHGKHTDEVINGVRVHRCYTYPRGTGSIKRILNYYSFAISSKKFVTSNKCKPQNGGTFDVVFINQLSPVMMAEAGIAYKKKHHVPLVHYCLDMWPESLIAGGIKRNSAIYIFFHRTSKQIYRSADRIMVSSRMFAKYLNRHFAIADEKISYLPQYAEEIFEPLPLKTPGEYRNLVFAGNIGEIQGLDTLIEAAELLKDEKVRFHIVGGGTDLGRLKEVVKKRQLEKNVFFYGRQPLEKMREYYELADAMIVTLKSDPVISLTLPGKVQTYMACAKPIIGSISGETARVIRDAGCGYCVKAEDAKSLAKVIKRFCSEDRTKEFSDNSLRYYQDNFQKDKVISILIKDLEDAMGVAS